MTLASNPPFKPNHFLIIYTHSKLNNQLKRDKLQNYKSQKLDKKTSHSHTLFLFFMSDEAGNRELYYQHYEQGVGGPPMFCDNNLSSFVGFDDPSYSYIMSLQAGLDYNSLAPTSFGFTSLSSSEVDNQKPPEGAGDLGTPLTHNSSVCSSSSEEEDSEKSKKEERQVIDKAEEGTGEGSNSNKKG